MNASSKVKSRLLEVICILFLVSMLASCGGPEFHASVVDPPLPVPDVELTDQYGKPFHTTEQKGKVVLFFFGYTMCPDVCPTTLATWRKVHTALGEDAQHVRFVFVTVDPERDTSERLGLHVNAFNPDFIGLTGPQADREALYEFFDVYFDKDTSTASAAGYLISHTASTFVVDSEGLWRLRISYGTEVDDIVHDIRQLFD